MDPNKNPGQVHHDGSPVEFGNTPSGGKFASPWTLHGWTADPEHKGNSGFKTSHVSVYAGGCDEDSLRKQKENGARKND